MCTCRGITKVILGSHGAWELGTVSLGLFILCVDKEKEDSAGGGAEPMGAVYMVGQERPVIIIR